MGNNNLIYAGTAAGGTDATALAWFGETTATAPTSATVPDVPLVGAGWYDTGLITEDGLTAQFTQEMKEIKAYGSMQVQRTLCTGEKTAFDLTFLETNQYSTAVWTRQLITYYTPDATGAWALTHGTYAAKRYSAIFETKDGSNRIRIYVPQIEVTDRKERKFAAGNELTWGVSLTAYPDASGNTAYEYIVMDALAS